MELIFVVKETHSNTISNWTIEDYLEEINRDRSSDWTDYTEKDLTEENNYLKDLFEEARYFELIVVYDAQDFYEDLKVIVEEKGVIYQGQSLKKATEVFETHYANYPHDEMVLIDDKYGDEIKWANIK